MASFDQNRQRQLGFFHALSKEALSSNQEPYESAFKSGHNVFNHDVLSDTVFFSATEADAIAFSSSHSHIVRRYEEFSMTVIPGTNNQAWQLIDGGLYMHPFITPTDVIAPDGAMSFGYDVKLYREDGTFIPPTLGAWNVSAYGGLILFNPGYTPVDLGWGNIKITCYVYVGQTLKESLSGVLEGTTWRPPVLSMSEADPSTLTPVEGNRYIVPDGSVGDWVGQDKNIARWSGFFWEFEIPEKGWTSIVLDTLDTVNFNGTEWVSISSGNTFENIFVRNLEKTNDFTKVHNGHGFLIPQGTFVVKDGYDSFNNCISVRPVIETDDEIFGVIREDIQINEVGGALTNGIWTAPSFDTTLSQYGDNVYLDENGLLTLSEDKHLIGSVLTLDINGKIFVSIGTSGTTSLQSAYNNSEQPEILTNSTLGAVSIKRGSLLDSDDVFEVLDGEDNIVASITGEGKITGKVLDVQDSLFLNGSSGTPNLVAHGNDAGKPTWSPVIEEDIELRDVNDNNTTLERHGFAPKLSGVPTQYLNGQGVWITPGSIANAYTSVGFSNQTSVVVIHGFGAFPIVQVMDSSGVVLVPLSIVNDSINQFTVSFVEQVSGTIIASLGSPQASNITTVSSDYLIISDDKIIEAVVAGIEITLPSAASLIGYEYTIDNNSLGNIQVLPQPGESISGKFFQDLNKDEAMSVYSNGTNWRIK